MAKLPPEVLEVIEAAPGPFTYHAQLDAIRLDLYWEDVIEVARTGDDWKREKDDHYEAVDGWKDSISGRDTHGRKLYLAGKKVYFDGELLWYVITFHEAK